jgi:ABC-type transport system involved in multi-copper enzyme maturation permease subunit
MIVPGLTSPSQAFAAVLLAALTLALLQWPLRRTLRWLLGPLFTLEITRLARQGTTIWLRCVYALALLLALYRSFPGEASADREDIARFAKDFSELFLLVQSVTVLFLVPLVFSGAISDEKEKRSLDFLLASPLTSREIVLGKYVPRVLSVAGILLAGLPVLALTALWGGVDLIQVGLAFAATFLTLISLGAVSLLFSVLCSRTVYAVAWSFAVVVTMSVCCGQSPGWAASQIMFQRVRYTPGDVDALATTLEYLAPFAVGHALVALIALGLAMVQLRWSAMPRRSAIEFFRRPEELKSVELPPPPIPTVALTSWRPIGRDALLWKECHIGRPNEPFFEALWLYFAGILATVAVPAFFGGMEQVRNVLAGIYLVIIALLTIGLCLGLLIDMAATITREREQRTLESLLTLPESRGRVLWSKALGALYRRDRWLFAIVGLLIVSLASGTLSTATVVLLAALVTSQAAFVAALSLLFSLMTRTTVRAYVLSFVAVAAVIIMTSITTRYRDDDRPFAPPNVFDPISAWVLAAHPQTDTGRALITAAVYLAAAMALACAAHWQFHRSERYT